MIQVWGRPERCDLTALKEALVPFLPPAPPSPHLWEPGVLESISTDAGLTPESAFDTSWAFEFPDEDTLARQMRAAANVAAAVRMAGEEAVRSAVVESLAPYRSPSGGYRLENEWHSLIASA